MKIDVRSIVDEIQRTHRCAVRVDQHADRAGCTVRYLDRETVYRGEVLWVAGKKESDLGWYSESFPAPREVEPEDWEVKVARAANRWDRAVGGALTQVQGKAQEMGVECDMAFIRRWLPYYMSQDFNYQYPKGGIWSEWVPEKKS